MRFIFHWFIFFQEQDPKRISVDGLERHRDERTEPRALQARDLGIFPHRLSSRCGIDRQQTSSTFVAQGAFESSACSSYPQWRCLRHVGYIPRTLIESTARSGTTDSTKPGDECESDCWSGSSCPFCKEKEKIVKEVVKQENAITAMQAIARAPFSRVLSCFLCLLWCTGQTAMGFFSRKCDVSKGGQRVRRQWRQRKGKEADSPDYILSKKLIFNFLPGIITEWFSNWSCEVSGKLSRSEFFMISFTCDCHKSHPVFLLSWDCKIKFSCFCRAFARFLICHHKKGNTCKLQSHKAVCFPPVFLVTFWSHHLFLITNRYHLWPSFHCYQGWPQHRIPQVMLRSNGGANDEKISITSCWKRNF